jgi:Protein of unknown function DUF262
MSMKEKQESEKFTLEQVEAAENQIVEQSKRIDFYLTEYSAELLADKTRNGDFEIPSYQREDTWEDSRKTRFIESLLMGIPIPFLFFWENPETGKLEIIDGAQRLRTIEQFILGDFVLGDLGELSLLSGFGFKDLPKSRQRKIKNRSIRGIVLNEHADARSRFEVFDRINTTPKIANKAEIRRGALGGPFLDLVITLSKDSLFVNLAAVSNKQFKEREREELVTRFFAYSDGLDNYRDRVAAFLFEYTKKMNFDFSENPEKIDIYRQKFISTMEFVSLNFTMGFRRTETGQVSPRARFEAIAIGSYLAIEARPRLAKKTIKVDKWLGSQEFIDITGADGANAVGRLKSRINYVRDRLLGI